MEQVNQKPQNGGFVIPREYLLQGIGEAVKDLKKELERARKKYGSRYNWKNDFEGCIRRFGLEDNEKLLNEYEKICQKKSNEPSSIRSVICQIGDNAREYALKKYIREHGTMSETPQNK